MKYLIILIFLLVNSISLAQIEKKLLFSSYVNKMFGEYNLCRFLDISDCNRQYFILIKSQELENLINGPYPTLMFGIQYYIKLIKIDIEEVPAINLRGHNIISIWEGTEIWANNKPSVDLFYVINFDKIE
ncbi:MAG TPA: hypothetical protein VFF33_12315 [Ignavibacteriaceae bacterium]|nr:hypothetical protein [Ignavibacteriaceae bacterium]